MPIVIDHSPSMGTIGKAAALGGYGQYAVQQGARNAETAQRNQELQLRAVQAQQGAYLDAMRMQLAYAQASDESALKWAGMEKQYAGLDQDAALRQQQFDLQRELATQKQDGYGLQRDMRERIAAEDRFSREQVSAANQQNRLDQISLRFNRAEQIEDERLSSAIGAIRMGVTAGDHSEEAARKKIAELYQQKAGLRLSAQQREQIEGVQHDKVQSDLESRLATDPQTGQRFIRGKDGEYKPVQAASGSGGGLTQSQFTKQLDSTYKQMQMDYQAKPPEQRGQAPTMEDAAKAVKEAVKLYEKYGNAEGRQGDEGAPGDLGPAGGSEAVTPAEIFVRPTQGAAQAPRGGTLVSRPADGALARLTDSEKLSPAQRAAAEEAWQLLRQHDRGGKQWDKETALQLYDRIGQIMPALAPAARQELQQALAKQGFEAAWPGMQSLRRLGRSEQTQQPLRRLGRAADGGEQEATNGPRVEVVAPGRVRIGPGSADAGQARGQGVAPGSRPATEAAARGEVYGPQKQAAAPFWPDASAEQDQQQRAAFGQAGREQQALAERIDQHEQAIIEFAEKNPQLLSEADKKAVAETKRRRAERQQLAQEPGAARGGNYGGPTDSTGATRSGAAELAKPQQTLASQVRQLAEIETKATGKDVGEALGKIADAVEREPIARMSDANFKALSEAALKQNRRLPDELRLAILAEVKRRAAVGNAPRGAVGMPHQAFGGVDMTRASTTGVR